FLVQDQQILKQIKDGVISKNPNREFNTNQMIFPVELNANSEVEVYFKIRNYNKIDIDFDLVNKAYLINYYQTYSLLEGLFFGGMLLMMLYNLFLYLLLHIRAYLYYVLYVFWVSVYFFGLFGYSQRYLEEFTYLFYLSSGAFFIFLTCFVQSILNLKKKLPKVNKLLNIFILYFILHTLINIYVLEQELFCYAQLLFNLFFTIIIVFVMLIVGSTYYLAYFKKDNIAKFYSIIWSLIALLGLSIPLKYLNLIHLPLSPDYLCQILILIEILFFSFILAYKINLIEKEKKRQQHLLVQQNKLASMGEMIRLIAHQWRQPLSEINGIVLNMDLDYQKKQLSQKPFYDYLDEIETITASMSHTINDFIDYFKHHKKVEEFKISDLINRALNLISTSNSDNITIKYLEHEEIILKSYRSELIQALLILLRNALDACSHESNLDNCEILISVTKEEKNVRISIKDNGCGIPTEIIDKIYDPYFTTKHESQGTGLGLYILKMMVEQTMLGKVEIISNNKVTIFSIIIPESVTK
ncbi:MAG TPA: GHKL domain-containing protein, partial [Campylobacterales bacterium]|nr:GHKL domain-containing protein [Campylobacterales bacterium]